MKIFSKKTKTDESRGRLYDDVYIPHELENIILRHVIINSLDYNDFRPAPLLFLQGRKGEGKSFMTETILKGNGIYYKIISSSTLTGRREGEAVDQLMLYYNSCEMDPVNGKYTALVIDDFHLSIAITKSKAGHTTNADNLIEALMNIADRKTKLKAPIILIGNDFTEAYPPLTRAGRANICTWEPSLDDKKEIVKRLIMRHNNSAIITDESINNLVEKYNDQYIGFFEKAIENVCFNKLENITNYFAEHKGQVSVYDLAERMENMVDSADLSVERIEEQARIILETQFEKFDR